MKRILLPCAALALAPSAFAVTHAVLPDTSIQEKVDLAQPGDIVAIFGGTYAQDVIVNKAIRLIEVDGQEVIITGNLSFTGITNPPPLEGLAVGSTGKGITVTNTTGLIIKNVDSGSGFGLRTIGNSKVHAIGGRFGAIYQDGGELTTSRSFVAGDFETSANSIKTIAFRLDVSGNYLWRSVRAWCGYSKGTRFKSSGNNGLVNVIDCEFDVRNYIYVGSESLSGNQNSGYFENYIIDIRGTGNTISIANNKIYRAPYAYARHDNQPYPFIYTIARGVFVAGHQSALITNNYIELIFSGSKNGSVTDAYGVKVESANAKIYSNIIEGAYIGIDAPFGADVRNNCTNGILSVIETGGHVSLGTVNSDPLFVVNEKPKLQAVSPCINAGIGDPIFNDLDGTRNDIGPGGGCLYDPQGWITENPVVISFNITPQQLLKGVDTQVILSNGIAVSQP